MRTLTIRIAVLIAAFAVISPSALAQEPSGGAAAPAAAPAPFRLSGGGGALLGKKVRFRGTVDAKLAGRPVVVQAFDPATEAWTKQAKTTVKPDGTFVARWKARKLGQFRTRALIGGSARTAAASPELTLTVFRPAIATWYGPGFYGNKTACGIELTETLVGVAHRTLPVRHHRRRPLRLDDDPRPGRRPRPVRRQGEVGPHEGRRGPARLHRRPTASAR